MASSHSRFASRHANPRLHLLAGPYAINMKSILFNKYGSTKDLTIGEVEKPIPKENEVLVKIHASSVNDWDWGLLRGKPFVNRVMFGMFKPKVKSLGIDIAGIVESVGQNVKKFQPQDEVLGDISASGWGGFAEYVCVKESALEFKSKEISFEQAAAFPHTGVLAIQGFMDEWRVEKGQHILINGAGGGAGTFAIQIAKEYGAIVTGVDKENKFETMISAGADKVIDYTKEDFTKNALKYDYILDMAGYHPLLDYKKSLTKGGKYLLVGGSSSLILQSVFLGPFISFFGDKKLKILAHEPNKYLKKLMELSEEGKIKPFIDSTYPLEEAPSAIDQFGKGTCLGKIIISIAN